MSDSQDTRQGHRRRLRERFGKTGLEGFHDYEGLELLLTYALARRDVKPAAKALIKRFGSLRGVLDAQTEELSSVRGVGEYSALLIRLVKELHGEYLKERVIKKDAIRSSADVVNYLKTTLSGERVEKFLALFLNTKNEVIAIETLHEGTIDRTIVYPRKTVERALVHNARSVIFVHNHPSGDHTPSVRDKELTDELVRATRPVDITVHDHIIIGKDGHFSGQEHGWFSKRRSVT